MLFHPRGSQPAEGPGSEGVRDIASADTEEFILDTRTNPNLSLQIPRPFPLTKLKKSSRPQTIQMRNLGDAPATALSTRVTGKAARDFVASQPSARSLAAGAPTTFAGDLRDLTDGLENASTRFTWKDLAAKIKERQEKDAWQFLFLGANQDAIATAAQMNIHAHNAATASYTDKGVQGSARAFSRKTKALRESLPAGEGGVPNEYPSEDLRRSMEQILREEEGRE